MRSLTGALSKDFGVGAVLDARLDADAAAPVAIALSGGGDSLALLHLASAWTSRVGRPLLALTVDHHLHPDSADWTRRAGDMARAVGANWRLLAWTDDKPATGVPAAARAARHRLLAQAAREARARVVLLAQTADDVLENARMRAGDAPGMGRLREWAPSPVWPEGRGVALLRPLLGARRAALREWLRVQGLSWLDDPANADLRHPRIRARQAADPCASAPPPLLEAPPLFAADAAGSAQASRAALFAVPSAVAQAQLAVALACVSGREASVRGRSAAALLVALASGADLRRNAGGSMVEAAGDRILITPEPRRRSAAPRGDPAWVAPRLDLALGRAATEAQLAS